MVHVSDPVMKGKAVEVAMASPVVKLEVEDPVEEEYGSLNKRSKPSSSFEKELQQEWRTAPLTVSCSQNESQQYNPLNEPSPLGLRLRKSPSLLDLIQLKLSKSNTSTSTSTSCSDTGKKKDGKSTGVSVSTDKLKASNFPASLLRIGSWECVSRYEGDLVAKCYFAKHKLVWEVLDGGLKSKIEIQWSDISALKASCSPNKDETLVVVLSRQPLFFKETNPQPRKHTLWQATSDFTDGQASIHKKHFLQCGPGLLNKHFEKLIHCDHHLYSLSQKPDILLDSPYFESRSSSLFEDQEEIKSHVFSHIGEYTPSSISGFHDVTSPCSGSPTSTRSDARDPIGSKIQDSASRETPSPSSEAAAVDMGLIEEHANCSEAKELKEPAYSDMFKVSGLHPSMSMNDLVNHIGNCISENMSTDDPQFSDAICSNKENKAILEELTQYLLSDSQLSAVSDENPLMSRVNSPCGLLQKDPASVQNLQVNKDNLPGDLGIEPVLDLPERVVNDDSSSKNNPAISRKDSFGDLLMDLPRVASMPKFLFNILEDSD